MSPLVFLSRSGPPAAMNCAAILCDHCGLPCHDNAEDWRERCNVIWFENARTREQSPLFFVHKGCYREWQEWPIKDAAGNTYKRGNGWLSLWNEGKDFLERLTYNYETPFRESVDDGRAEFVPPDGYDWQIGKWDRERHP